MKKFKNFNRKTTLMWAVITALAFAPCQASFFTKSFRRLGSTLSSTQKRLFGAAAIASSSIALRQTSLYNATPQKETTPIVTLKNGIGTGIFSSIQKALTSSPEMIPSLDRWFSWWCSTSTHDKKNTPQLHINAKELITALEGVAQINHKNLAGSMLNPKAYQPTKKDFLYAARSEHPSESTFYFWGDLHGDIRSLIITLKRLVQQGIINDKLEIQQKHVRLIFGGDYVDRGDYGAEVLYVLSILKLANPEQVTLIRGNHEDITINENGGFTGEIQSKFPGKDGQKLLNSVQRFYTSLPAVQFVGVPGSKAHERNYLQFCHGCMELGHNPQKLIESPANNEIMERFERWDFFKELQTLEETQPQSSRALYSLFSRPTTMWGEIVLALFMKSEGAVPQNCGYMWSDVSAGADGNNTDLSHHTPGRGLSYGTLLRNVVSANSAWNEAEHKLIAIFRAHQHNHTMPQLLSKNKHLGSTGANNSLYVVPRGEGDMSIPVFTTVATDLFTPSPSFIQLNLNTDPTKWELTNHYVNGSPTRPDTVKDLQTGANSVWGSKQGNVLSWTNEEN